MKTPIRSKREGFFGKAALFIGDMFGRKKTDSTSKDKKKFQGATNFIHHLIGGGIGWNPQAIFIPRNSYKKFKKGVNEGRRHSKFGFNSSK